MKINCHILNKTKQKISRPKQKTAAGKSSLPTEQSPRCDTLKTN